jgi:hypothetical protein
MGLDAPRDPGRPPDLIIGAQHQLCGIDRSKSMKIRARRSADAPIIRSWAIRAALMGIASESRPPRPV